jgi:hypothetical protein
MSGAAAEFVLSDVETKAEGFRVSALKTVEDSD